jgi:hypothetical protein
VSWGDNVSYLLSKMSILCPSKNEVAFKITI